MSMRVDCLSPERRLLARKSAHADALLAGHQIRAAVFGGAWLLRHHPQDQKAGTVSSSLGPRRNGAIRSASPVRSEISTPTPHSVAGPTAASNRPFGTLVRNRLSGSSLSIPSDES